MIECKSCKTLEDKKSCVGWKWYAPHMIKYCFNQIFWLIGTFAQRGKGEWEIFGDFWPSEGWSEENGKRYTCPFEEVVCVLAELNLRLKRTGKDGKWLIDVIASREDKDSLFQHENLSREPKLALIYISGSRRKSTKYSTWVATYRYRHSE